MSDLFFSNVIRFMIMLTRECINPGMFAVSSDQCAWSPNFSVSQQLLALGDSPLSQYFLFQVFLFTFLHVADGERHMTHDWMCFSFAVCSRLDAVQEEHLSSV